MNGATVPNQITSITGNTTDGLFTAIANSTLYDDTKKDDWITPTPGIFFGATFVLIVITVLIPLFLPATFTYVTRKVTKPSFRGVVWWIWLGISFTLNLAFDIVLFQLRLHFSGSVEADREPRSWLDKIVPMESLFITVFTFNMITLGVMFLGGCWWYYYTRNEKPGVWRRMWGRMGYLLFWLSLFASYLKQTLWNAQEGLFSLFTDTSLSTTELFFRLFWGLTPYIVYALLLLGVAIAKCCRQRRGRPWKQYNHLKR
jgi:hypothetical protein